MCLIPLLILHRAPRQARAPSQARAARVVARVVAKVAAKVAAKVVERGKERGAAARVAGKVVEKVVERGEERAAPTESTENIAITTNRRTLRTGPRAITNNGRTLRIRPPGRAVFLVNYRLNWRQGSQLRQLAQLERSNKMPSLLIYVP